MLLSNYHIHTKFCDGKGEPEEYIELALKNNIHYLGFSSHAPLPFDTTWNMNQDDFDRYKNCITYLKNKYKDIINIFLGLEIDYIPNLVSPNSNKVKQMGLDYTIGAVHYLVQFDNGDYWTADGSIDEFNQGLDYLFQGDIKKAIARYYNHINEMVLYHPPDIIAHLDVIKKNNKTGSYFSESENWYRDLVMRSLNHISKSKCIVEVNSGGINRKRIDDYYPSQWILEECFKLNIPVTVNSDAHKPEQVYGNLVEAIQLLKDIGFKEIARLTHTGWIMSQI